MALEPKLTQEQRQRLILTPQLRQLIHLLQLPIMELRVLIQKEIMENPVLEEAEGTTEGSTQQESEENLPIENEELKFSEEFAKLARLEDSWKESFYQGPLEKFTKEQVERRSYQEGLITRSKTLASHLLGQLSLMELKEDERRIAEVIIGNIDEDGYLRTDLKDIAKSCNLPLPLAERVLLLIQSFDPPGVGGRCLAEALLIQLKGNRRVERLAREIVKDHLKDLERKRYKRIAKSLKAPVNRVREAVQLISHLEPKPGRGFSAEPPQTIIPDIILEKVDDELTLTINDKELPPLRISPLYKRLMNKKDLDPSTKAYIKNKVKAGFWLIRAIEQRHLTLNKITQEIVKYQDGFLKRGEPLKPLRLKDIAKSCSIHPSTVSRALANKYIQTPQGVMAMKELFSGRVKTQKGLIESKKGIKDRIASLIAEEDHRRPLSDLKIAKILSEAGFMVARRTVNKYRDELKILPASLRRD